MHCTRQTGGLQACLVGFDEAIRQLPDYGEAYYERNAIYKAMGKMNLSKKDLESAKKFGYNVPEAMK